MYEMFDSSQTYLQGGCQLEKELESEDVVDTDKNYTDTVKNADGFSWDQVLEDDMDDSDDFINILE